MLQSQGSRSTFIHGEAGFRKGPVGMLASVHCPDSGSVTVAAVQVQGLHGDITGHHRHLAAAQDALPVGGLYSIPSREQGRHGERNLCFNLPPLGGKQGARGELE